jgi:hypothetical protein
MFVHFVMGCSDTTTEKISGTGRNMRSFLPLRLVDDDDVDNLDDYN